MSLPMDLTEKMLSREEKYTGAFLSVHVDQVSLPNGHTSFREVVEHVDGVAVLPLDERNNVITVSQYRYVFGKTLLEIPAGKLDPGEEPGRRRAAGAAGGDRRSTGYFDAPGRHSALSRLLRGASASVFGPGTENGPAAAGRG